MLAECVYFCWRCSSNALKQDNQATILLGSSIWIPYFLVALSAMNISTMEWRSFLRAYWVFTLSRCSSIELKQDNQATIHHGSSTWIPYFGLKTNSASRFLWCCGSVCSHLLSFFLIRLKVLSPMNPKRLTYQWFSILLQLEAYIQLGASRENIFIGLKQRL